MISTIRSNMDSKAFKAVLFISMVSIAGGSVIFGLFEWIMGSKQSGIVTVNGHPISQQDLRRKALAVQNKIQAIKMQAGDFADMFLQSLGMVGDPVQIALREAITEKVLADAAEKSGLNAFSPDFVGEKVSNSAFALQYFSEYIPYTCYTSLGKLDQDKLFKFLRSQGISIQSFEENIENALRRIIFLDLLRSAFYSTENNNKFGSLRNAQSREFVVLDFKIDSYLKNIRKSAIENSVLKDFFVKNNSLSHRYWVPEKRSATIITFKQGSYGITVSEKEIQRYFSQNQHQFPNKKLSDVTKEIEKKLKQEKFRKRFSADARRSLAEKKPKILDDFVKKHKGVRSQRVNEEINPSSPISKKMFAITGVGKEALLVNADEGIIILLDSVEKTFEPSLESVKKEVENDYVQEAALQALKKDIESAHRALREKSLDEVVADFGVNKKHYRLTDDDSFKKIKKDGLPVERMKRMIHENGVIKHMTPKKGSLVILEKLEPGSYEKPKEVEIDAQESQFFLMAFVASLENNATIDYSEKLARA